MRRLLTVGPHSLFRGYVKYLCDGKVRVMLPFWDVTCYIDILRVVNMWHVM